jgi:suppressor of G2 allele of SKP1
MAGLDAYHAANALFVDEEYEAALASYTRALEAEPENATYFAHRAAALLRLGQHVDAAADVSKALKIAPTLKAFVRKGEALFLMEEFDAAALAFRKGLELVPDSIVARRWIRKCEVRSARIARAGRARDVRPARSRPAPKLTRAARVRPASQAELSGAVLPLAPLPAQADPIPPPPAAAVATAATPAAARAPAPVAATSDPSRVRHEWYQTLTHVVVTILARGVSAADVRVSYEPAALSAEVSLRGGAGAEYQLHLELFAQIDVTACAHTVDASRVEIKLKKAVAAKWDTLEGTGEGGLAAYQPPAHGAAEPAAAAGSSRPAYPTSRPKKTDWDKVESEVTKEEESAKLDGDEALQKLFRDIYARSDEDTRRAMNKSFQTSGGTVLSTNWGEVGTKDYEKERTAPDGQEWKKWG